MHVGHRLPNSNLTCINSVLTPSKPGFNGMQVSFLMESPLGLTSIYMYREDLMHNRKLWSLLSLVLALTLPLSACATPRRRWSRSL
jgi:hypothetical protein